MILTASIVLDEQESGVFRHNFFVGGQCLMCLLKMADLTGHEQSRVRGFSYFMMLAEPNKL